MDSSVTRINESIRTFIIPPFFSRAGHGSTSSVAARRAKPSFAEELGEGVFGARSVLLVVEEQAERFFEGLGIDAALAEQEQRARPVDGLADAGRLAQVHRP